ncbi:MAG: hypothetical protein ACFHWX_07195 [Bacteroidota bacterium]
METGFEATIFTPSDRIDWRPTSSRLLYGGLAVVLTYSFLKFIFEFEANFNGLAILFLFISVAGAIWGWTEKERPNGRVYGTLIVSDEGITINGTRYKWSEISNFSFNLLHILGEYLHTIGYRFYGGPAYSAGVDSYIEFSHESEQFKVFFRVNTPSHYADISNAFRKLYFIGKIQLQTTYNGLHLTYDEIQELKQGKLEFNKESS